VHTLCENEKNAENGTLSAKLLRVYNKLESFAKTQITEDLVRDVFYIQDLVNEVKKQ